MKKITKSLALLAGSATLAFSLAACGGGTSPEALHSADDSASCVVKEEIGKLTAVYDFKKGTLTLTGDNLGDKQVAAPLSKLAVDDKDHAKKLQAALPAACQVPF